MTEGNGRKPYEKTCGARNRQGQPCGRPAGWGTTHQGYGNCKFHFGATPAGTKSAQKAMAEDLVVTYGLPREIDPHAALLEELYRTAGWIVFCEARLKEAGEDVLFTSTMFGPSPNEWYQLMERERRHMAKVARDAIAAGVEERRVLLAEQQGALIADVFRRVFDDPALGLSEQQKEMMPGVVARHLRTIDAA